MALHPQPCSGPVPLPLGEPFPCCGPWEPSLGPSWLQALAATRWSEEAGGDRALPPWLRSFGAWLGRGPLCVNSHAASMLSSRSRSSGPRSDGTDLSGLRTHPRAQP